MALVVLVGCASLLGVPLVAMLGLKIGTNWFVHETESSLIKQASIYAGAYAAAFEAEVRETNDGAATPGYYLPPDKRVFWSAEVRTFRSFLNLRGNEIEPFRPDAVPSTQLLDIRYQNIAADLAALEQRANRTTLSRADFLDFQGLDLLADTPMSFASVPEVQKALRGEIGAALRWRSDADARTSFLSFSRGKGFRVFVAYPVISSNRVIGVVYMSRTPSQFDSYVSEEATAFVVLIAVTLLGAVIVGTFLVRTLLRPIQALRDQSRLVARGAHDDLVPLHHYGMREIAELGDAVMTMAGSLSQRRREIAIYTNHVTHELKSPVTAIVASAELLEDGGLPDAVERKLLATIRAQGERMGRLLSQLREMTQSRQHAPGHPGLLRDMIPAASELSIILNDPDAVLPLSAAHGETILVHMVQNARHHGADRLMLDWNGSRLRLSDNGAGFVAVDLGRLGEPFFTTRRDQGGTGLGLAIVMSILELYGARLLAVPGADGAVFEIDFD
jgi:two-component system, OmpR family, sensor histidine kinase CreC